MIQTPSTLRQNKMILGKHSGQVRLLAHEGPTGGESCTTLENLRENVLSREGQFIALNLAELQTETFSETFYEAMKDACRDQPFLFSLPIVVRRDPQIASSFINGAILWQRLCDLLLLDDTPTRETVLMLENVHQASPAVQHEIVRLFRFHETYSLHRQFVFTWGSSSRTPFITELQTLLKSRKLVA